MFMNIWWVEVWACRPAWDVRGAAMRDRLRSRGMENVELVRACRLYFLGGRLGAAGVERLADELLCDPVSERFRFGQSAREVGEREGVSVEVHLRAGVTDPVAESMLAAARDLGVEVSVARTGWRYEISGLTDAGQLECAATRILANECVERAYLRGLGRADAAPLGFPEPPVADGGIRRVALGELNDEALGKMSRGRHLFLSVEEMCAVRDSFRSLERDPTDLELETLAQTWSEHCAHKTLRSEVVYRGAAIPSPDRPRPEANATFEIRYGDLLRDTIIRATNTLNRDWCLSVFRDNAGIVAFDEEFGIAFKVETHNHPSAIAPYGGAATGVGGCVRDILGCGLGAKPIACTDVFCLAPPDWPMGRLPAGVVHPRAVLEGVVGGVRDYGNRLGIPTVNGAVYFDARYLGNPLVYVGCVGIIPRRFIEKAVQPGDRIVLVGGRTGRDGIHGATFSSAELTDKHADEFLHAVQIGNPITEKKMLDCILRARDAAAGCLFSAITDCGAGGLSSAVGEMGAETGAWVDLEKVPLKYSGLRYDEIWISEAQERMVLAVPVANLDALLEVFASEDVEATVIGKFTDDGRLTVRHRGETVGELSMEFLHKGCPSRVLTAEWPPSSPQPNTDTEPPESDGAWGPAERLKARLADINTASREWIIRQYDHEVQGGSVVKPLVGCGDGPSDGAVIRPRLDSDRGIAIGCGLCSELSEEDPYWMAVAAVDEALRNVVCVGGDPARTAILDNFCWPKCDNKKALGALVRACQGAHDAAVAYGLPFISGKDSLNNEFVMSDEEAARCGLPRSLAIPPTLLISAVSVIEDVARCVSSAARTDRGKTQFWYIGHPTREWDAVSLADRLKVHQTVARLIREGEVVAAHDVGTDGVLVALAEMAIGGRCGMVIDAAHDDPERDRFAARSGGYVVQVIEQRGSDAIRACGELAVPFEGAIAVLDEAAELRIVSASERIDVVRLAELEEVWKRPLRSIGDGVGCE